MELMEMIQKSTGAQAAMGLYLAEASEMPTLPEGCRPFASCGNVQFCHVEGYLDTVFAIKTGFDTSATPLAYSFADFIRLILACGSAQAAAEGVVQLDRRKKLEKLIPFFKLSPMQDPIAYMQTVEQVIDCSGISFKKGN